MHLKLIENDKLFTLETADVFTAEVIECPCCGFAFATKHDLCNDPGFYECPACTESELMDENSRLKRKIERYEKALQEILKLDDRHKWNLYGLAYSIAEKALMDMRNS